MLYNIFWVIPRCLNFICQRFGTLSVLKHRHIKFRRRGTTQEKAHNSKNLFMSYTEKIKQEIVLKKNLNLDNNTCRATHLRFRNTVLDNKNTRSRSGQFKFSPVAETSAKFGLPAENTQAQNSE